MASPFSNNDDPYKVLGISQNATKQEIRAAYRKLALRHHPDRQASETEKRAANQKFAAISHAYEILSDDVSRQEYNLQQQQQASYEFPSHYEFRDPFQVFAHVFGNEFGRTSGGGSSSFGGGSSFGSFQQQRQQDPFFSDPFGGDSFFGGSTFGSSMFGGGNNDMISQMNRQMDMMRQQAQQQNGGQSSSSSYYYSSSSSTFGGNGGRRGESVSTTTRMVNGKRQTVTERTIHKPDGTVERHTETSGDEDFPEQYRLDSQGRPQLPSSTEEEHDDADIQPSPWKKMKRRLTGGSKGDK